jgi:hypothetical protein
VNDLRYIACNLWHDSSAISGQLLFENSSANSVRGEPTNCFLQLFGQSALTVAQNFAIKFFSADRVNSISVLYGVASGGEEALSTALDLKTVTELSSVCCLRVCARKRKEWQTQYVSEFEDNDLAEPAESEELAKRDERW